VPTRIAIRSIALAVLLVGTTAVSAAERYGSFGAAIYARAYEVREMADLDRLRAASR